MNAITSSDRMPTNDERRAAWAIRFYGGGWHRITRADLTELHRVEAPGRVTVPPPYSHTRPAAPGKDS